MSNKLQVMETTSIEAVFGKLKKRSIKERTAHVSHRKNKLHALESWILNNSSRIKNDVFADFKKPLTEVDTTEIYPVLAELRFALANINEWTSPKKVDAPITYLGTRSHIQVEPKGVCLIISPWNFPFNLAIGPLVSCLAAGNTAILKPSELTPHTSKLLKEMVSEIFDEDCVAVIEGGVETTTGLLALPFDHIFFTGSPSVGKIVMKAAAENLASITLELGGKSPAIIEATANSKDAARRIAFGKFFNSGQTCVAPDYVLVEASIEATFLAELKKATDELFGENKLTSKHYARIVNARHFARLTQALNEAIQKGAKIQFGGELVEAENFISPTVLTQVAIDSALMQEEIFGPLLPVITFKTKEEAIQWINAKPKPLALYLFGNDKAFKSEVLGQTSAGSVCINECVLQFSHPHLPFGGVNTSGIGKSHGYAGFLAFSNEKPVMSQKRGFAISYLFHPPYTSLKQRIVQLLIRWF
jgi:aldehyde dehydrogenase (NAD+)